ncbi:DUF6732 family protein [Maritalea myrionectae]|uniref:Uncharacterized protein n=1 Tax=Maritalea myrionectae TaxID=454601 RepID=A0A2R4MI07_9HYPH|nr:DUF6732 family protein [Maritalea myrionectae]AVX05661.1 hypothetical protein MXMO3_03155 [Maritalea myrionectae]
MKYILASIFALLPSLALAHPGHTEVVSGHTHTLADLMAYGAIPVIVFLAFIGVVALARRGNK